MAEEKENFLETLFKILGLIGGGWLAIELLKAFSKEVYLCPHCDYEIEEKGISQCPHCQVKLIWKI